MLMHTEEGLNHAFCSLCMDMGPIDFRALDPSPSPALAPWPKQSTETTGTTPQHPDTTEATTEFMSDAESSDENTFHDTMSHSYEPSTLDTNSQSDEIINGSVSSDMDQHPVAASTVVMFTSRNRGTSFDPIPTGPKENNQHDYYTGTAPEHELAEHRATCVFLAMMMTNNTTAFTTCSC